MHENRETSRMSAQADRSGKVKERSSGPVRFEADWGLTKSIPIFWEWVSCRRINRAEITSRPIPTQEWIELPPVFSRPRFKPAWRSASSN